MFATFTRTLLLLSAAVLAACGAHPCGGGFAQIQSNPMPKLRWPLTTVAVCWDDAGAVSASDRAYVRTAVSGAISAHAAVSFTGWDNCPTGFFDGVRVSEADRDPHTEGLGTELRGERSGIVINTSFQAWGKECSTNEGQRLRCVKAVAVHEFLHALGFAHEQNRNDTPVACQKTEQGENGVAYGAWDSHSVLNYCNPVWNNDGELSATDVKALQFLYGPPAPQQSATSPDQKAGSCSK